MKTRRSKAAKEIGFPLMIKAAEGGGGRGMRVVNSAGELIGAFQTARNEAQQAFGCANVYFERLIERPRHIEFQVMGDLFGDVIHFGERECSIQRRHQKVLEESPSPALDTKTRKDVGDKVVDALKKLKYSSAGTVEFLRDSTGKLYFIEMNARIQVEHPVTEMVTGVDLVKSQIRVAAGEKLKDVVGPFEFRGHAIECRINAEDPETFAPSAGRITAFRVPGGPGIRVDTASLFRRGDSAVLRFAGGEIDHARARPRRSHYAHARRARRLRRRRHQDNDPAAPPNFDGRRVPRGKLRHPFP